MDKRTIIAFIFIALIIILMPHYMEWITGGRPPATDSNGDGVLREPQLREAPPAPVPTPSGPALDSTQARAGERRSRGQEVAVPRAETSAEAFTPRPVVVETERFVATFTTDGARLVSLRLKDYLDAWGEWLELMAPGSAGLGVSLNGAVLEGLEFIPDRDRLVLYGQEQGEIRFRAQMEGVGLEKRLRFQGNRYRIELDLVGSATRAAGKVGMRWDGGLANTEGAVGDNAAYARIVTRVGEEVESWDTGDLGPGATLPSGTVSWVGIRNKYFLATLIPPEGRYDLNLEGTQGEMGEKDYGAELVGEMGAGPMRFGIFIGPISYDVLRAQNRDLHGGERELELDEFMEYGWAFFRPIMKPVTILILKAFLSLHQLVPNYGLVIVVFSILVKIIVFPLTHKSLEAAAKMQELQPQIAALKEKYSGGDQQKMNQELMKLYKEQKVNPLGGCLPMVLQMPILISLFNVFRGAIELRQSGFILWIVDLSQPDRLLLGGTEVHVLPLLMGVSMFIQQKMTMKDPKQAMMVYIMPVFLTWIFWTMSSGLVLYWTMFNVLTLLQQQVMERTKRVLANR